MLSKSKDENGVINEMAEISYNYKSMRMAWLL